MKSQHKYAVLFTALLLVLAFTLAACSAQPVAQESKPPEPETATPQPKPEEAPPAVKMPQPGESGVLYAEDWQEMFPEIYESYMANSKNESNYSYVEAHPEIQTLYKGMGFSFDYNSARGHSYTLDDITATTRPHALANCLSCKTSDFAALVDKYGADLYKMEFDVAMQEVHSTVSCYDCHGNDPTAKTGAARNYLTDALGSDYASIKGGVTACAQCHIEYYFDPETKATTLPYSGIASISPEQILAYYNELGFKDFENPDTLSPMLKVQHPEFETVMGAGSKHAGVVSCSDCHMEKVTGSATYTSHTWVSPLSNENIAKNTCLPCHGGTAEDIFKKVETTQTEVTEKTNEVGALLLTLTNNLADAVASGSYTEEKLNEIRKLNRDAQFYWDFVFVENSNGAHNSTLAKDCLAKSEALIEQAMALLS